MSDRALRGSIVLISAAVIGFLMWLIYGRGDLASTAPGVAAPGHDASVLPLLNATFNFLCALCLVAGYRAIRAGERQRHIALMLAAVVFSALFLGGYVTHHATAGDTPFPGQGIVRPVYFTILITHVLVTIVALPMILLTLARAAAGRFLDHKRIARRTLPLWLYVSVTGVMIFVFLRLSA